MTKETFKKPVVIFGLGVLIGALLIWISRGFAAGSWNPFSIDSKEEVTGGKTIRRINFPSIPENIFTNTPTSVERQGISTPYGYKLCGAKSFVLPQDVDPLKVKTFIDQLKSEFKIMASNGIKILLGVNLNPNNLNPGSILTFSVYAVNCNDEWPKKAVEYINNIH